MYQIEKDLLKVVYFAHKHIRRAEEIDTNLKFQHHNKPMPQNWTARGAAVSVMTRMMQHQEVE